MSSKLLFPLFALAVLLTACTPAEEAPEPVVPVQPPKAVQESSLASFGYSSSTASIFKVEPLLEE
jgi:hypothetical protein